MSSTLSKLVFLFTAIFFALFFVWPIFGTLQGAFVGSDGRWTLDYIAEVFRNPIYLEGLWNSLLMGIFSTLLTAVIALPLAVISDRYLFPGKSLLGAFLLIPMILPPFVGAIGVKQILGQQGAFNALLESLGLMDPAHPMDWLGEGRLWGVILMNALHLYPILYLNVLAALANVDPAMEEAAENLGCTGFRKFRKITLPLIMPGLFAGGTIIFIWSFTELGVPLMFEFTRVTSVQIFSGIKDIGGNPFPFALVAVLLTSTVIFYGMGKFFFGRNSHAMMAKATSLGGPRKVGWLGGALCTGFFCLITFLAILPHLGVILVAFSKDWYATILPTGWTLSHFEAALGHNLTLPSIQNSLKYAALATVLDLILGISIAYVVVRTRLVGRQILDAMAMLPLAVPGLVLAFGYLAMTQEGALMNLASSILAIPAGLASLLGHQEVSVRLTETVAADFGKFLVRHLSPAVDPLIIIVIAYSVRRLPYVVRSAAAGFQQTSVTLEEAAQNLGCPPLRTLRKITLPLIAANLMAGGLLAFSFAMLEVSDSLILAQKQQDFPITKAIYELYQLLGEGRFVASALGVWAMAFLAVTIIGASLILGKKLGAIFRV
ncbi:MAG: iron ABC transporter permease [Chthoniobacterales bacterium]|nr:iron ABC transporter permease [Chthoniobacterales bacterium]